MLGWAVEYLADPRTAVAIVGLVLLAALAARPVALLTGWPVWTTAAMLQAAAVVGILTLGPAPGMPVTGPDGAAIVDCVQSLADPSAWWRGLIATTDRGERVGNVLMFTPLGFFAVLATRRPAVVAVVGVLAPCAIEFGQVLIGGGRDCAANDWLNNATGLLLGVVAGVVVLRWFSTLSDRQHRS
jgi:VanZ like family